MKDLGGIASLLFIMTFQVPHSALNTDVTLLILPEGSQI